jgi:type II secretory pathway pseudopilin PulG
MAIVLIILTLIVGTALVPLGAQIEQRQRAETQRTLDEIKEALIGYTLSHGVLPCPSDKDPITGNPNGVAITDCTTSIIATGYIPWVTLGVNNHDAWGNLIRYAVATEFANPNNQFKLDIVTPTPTNTIAQITANTITIATRDISGNFTTLSSTIPALVFSTGKNGYNGLSADFKQQSPIPSSNPDEKQNFGTCLSSPPTPSPCISRTPAPAGTSTTLGGEFDDMVVWISPNILFNRMVAAGVLPR